MSDCPPLSCAKCGAVAGSGDQFCEACGADLQEAPARQPEPRDHQEVDAGWAAGVSDRGFHHHRNEDALCLTTLGPGQLVAVVCDGVSSSVEADVASQTAVDAVGRVLIDWLGNRPDQLPEATTAAMAEAQAAVTAIAWTPVDDLSAPSCTLVSAVVDDGMVTVGCVGDSRVYWLGADGPRQLTVDDSWATEQVASGAMTEEQALADPRAHAITRWLGTDAPEEDPQVLSFTPATAGRLLLCSDGLWNYAPTAGELAQLADQDPADPSALELARALTQFALAAGGHDNITVVVADIVPASAKGCS